MRCVGESGPGKWTDPARAARCTDTCAQRVRYAFGPDLALHLHLAECGRSGRGPAAVVARHDSTVGVPTEHTQRAVRWIHVGTLQHGQRADARAILCGARRAPRLPARHGGVRPLGASTTTTARGWCRADPPVCCSRPATGPGIRCRRASSSHWPPLRGVGGGRVPFLADDRPPNGVVSARSAARRSSAGASRVVPGARRARRPTWPAMVR